VRGAMNSWSLLSIFVLLLASILVVLQTVLRLLEASGLFVLVLRRDD